MEAQALLCRVKQVTAGHRDDVVCVPLVLVGPAYAFRERLHRVLSVLRISQVPVASWSLRAHLGGNQGVPQVFVGRDTF